MSEPNRQVAFESEPWFAGLRKTPTIYPWTNDNLGRPLVQIKPEDLSALLNIAEAACAHVEQRRRAAGISEWPRLLTAVAALEARAKASHE